MITQQVQIKVNLPLSLKEFLESKAQKYDMPLAGYIKHLILTDVKDMDVPVFPISKKSAERARKALKEKKKAVNVKNVSSYFESLS